MSWAPPQSWWERGIQCYRFSTGGGLHLWLRQHHAYDLKRVEKAYWTTRQRAQRVNYDKAFADVVALGVAYSPCQGNCDQPCFYRHVARPYGDQTGIELEHCYPLPGGGMGCLYGEAPPEHGPVNMAAGEAWWRALEALKTANGRWLSWKAHLESLLIDYVKARASADRDRTAHVVVNGRDYWLAAHYVQYGPVWKVVHVAGEPRVEFVL